MSAAAPASRTPATLAVVLGNDPGPTLSADSRRLLAALHAHALAVPPDQLPTVPAGRALRRDQLPEFTRARYAAAMRGALDHDLYRLTDRPGGGRHIVVTVPAPAERLLASRPPLCESVVCLEVERPFGYADPAAFRRDVHGVGLPMPPGHRLVINIGDAGQPHPHIVDYLRMLRDVGDVRGPVKVTGRDAQAVHAWERDLNRGV